jgi:protocatechuate 3,4-dioxygenase beta subunit
LCASATGAAALFVGCGTSQGMPRHDAGGGDAHDANPFACDPTAPNIEGPFYLPGAPSRVVLVTDDLPGTRLHLSGQVLDASTCAPLPAATLDIWQADADGAYHSTDFVLRGQLQTDAEGAYELITIIPGHYLNGAQYRPAHIHAKASAPGYHLLTTQLYFEGDEFNDIDPFIHESLIMPLTEDETGVVHATFDFVLTA